MLNRASYFLTTLIILCMAVPIVAEAESDTAKKIRVRFSTSNEQPSQRSLAARPASAPTMEVIETRTVTRRGPRQRNPEISSQHMVVIGFDIQEREISRTVIADPRLVRAETFGPTGEVISSERIYRNNIEFPVVFSDDPRISTLRFYHPNWTGKKLDLQLIGETRLP